MSQSGSLSFSARTCASSSPAATSDFSVRSASSGGVFDTYTLIQGVDLRQGSLPIAGQGINPGAQGIQFDAFINGRLLPPEPADQAQPGQRQHQGDQRQAPSGAGRAHVRCPESELVVVASVLIAPDGSSAAALAAEVLLLSVIGLAPGSAVQF